MQFRSRNARMELLEQSHLSNSSISLQLLDKSLPTPHHRSTKQRLLMDTLEWKISQLHLNFKPLALLLK
jgi:hypothetical protein